MTTENEKKRKELAEYLEIDENEIQIEDEDSKDIPRYPRPAARDQDGALSPPPCIRLSAYSAA